MKHLHIILLLSVFFFSCKSKKEAGLLVYNASIYLVDSAFSMAEAMVISDGKILATGNRATLETEFNAKETLDAGGKFIYPGFIDAHAHFAGYGQSLLKVDLNGTASWEDCLEKVKAFAKAHPEGWLTGRGWDQNDWTVKKFPDNSRLNELFPDRPVLLTRVDGHAAIANEKALNLAGLKPDTRLTGGEVLTANGRLTGLLIDNAVDLVSNQLPAADKKNLKEALQAAEKNCFAAGLTGITDCGLSFSTVETIKELQTAGDLKMRLNILLSDAPENYQYALEKGPYSSDRLRVAGFKVYGDGALGSRGACLLHPYSDLPGHTGFLLSSKEHFDSVAAWMFEKRWQLCTHAIGDSGNRVILQTYARYLKAGNDLRWRIEHAQVLHPDDFSLFGQYAIIPSVQPTHATSDMYWAGERLGAEREKGAYAYRQLLEQNGWLPLGTDFPVEDISPFKTFYAATIRKDAKGWPEGGYLTANSLSREQALRGMTIWAAKAGFEEKMKGSLEKGKWADFVIVDTDLMKADAGKLLNAKVLYTFLAGEKVYSAK